MKAICVYKGLGMYDETSRVLLKSLSELSDTSQYSVEYVTPDQIIAGKCSTEFCLIYHPSEPTKRCLNSETLSH